MIDLVAPRRAGLWLALAAQLVVLGALLAGRRGKVPAGATCWAAALYPAVRAARARRRLRAPTQLLVWNDLPAGRVVLGPGFEVTPQMTEAWIALRRVLHAAGQERLVSIEEDLLDGHAILIGQPGSGKTRAMELLLAQAIRRGDAVAVIDPKGDRGLLDRAAAEAGDRFRFFSTAHPSRSVAYNPLGCFVHVREVADRVAALLPSRGEAEAFRAFAWEAVFVCAQAMHAAGMPITLARLRQNVLDGLPALARVCAERLEGREELALLEALASRPADHYARTVAGLMPALAKLTSGTNRRLLSPEPHEPAISWEEIDERGLTVYFGTAALLGADSAQAVARMALADALSYVGARYAYGAARRRLWLFVDEAGDVATPEFVAALNKARGAGVTIVAAAQSTSDFAAAMGSAARERQVRANAGTIVRFATSDGEEAQQFAASCGRKPLRLVEEASTYEPSFFHAGFRDVDDFRAQFGQRTRLVEMPIVPDWAVMELPRLHAFVRAGGRVWKVRVPLLRPPARSFARALREG